MALEQDSQASQDPGDAPELIDLLRLALTAATPKHDDPLRYLASIAPTPPAPDEVRRVFFREGPVAAYQVVERWGCEFYEWTRLNWDDDGNDLLHVFFPDEDDFYGALNRVVDDEAPYRTLRALCRRFPWAARQIGAEVRRRNDRSERLGWGYHPFDRIEETAWEQLARHRPACVPARVRCGQVTRPRARGRRARAATRAGPSSDDESDGPARGRHPFHEGATA